MIAKLLVISCKGKEFCTEDINQSILQSTFVNTSISLLKYEVGPDVGILSNFLFLMPKGDQALVADTRVTTFEQDEFD